MMKILSNKKLSLYIVVGIVFLLCFGVTYAYFRTTFDLESSVNQIVTETGTLELNYLDGEYINEPNVYPGFQVSKTIVVTNIGSLDAYYKIYWRELHNSVERDELVLSAICTSYENYNTDSQVISGSCDDIMEAPIVNVAGSIKDNIGIESGFTHVYTFIFKFKEMSSLQNYNQGKSFSGVINIDDSYGLYTMYGTLLDSNGNTLPNRTILLHSEPREAVTDENGKFTFENIEEGNHTISILEEDIESSMEIQTGTDVSSSGNKITSNIENKEINVIIQLGNNTLIYSVGDPTKYDINVVALYVDGVKVTNLDANEKYKLINYTCTNSETITWSNEDHSIKINPANTKTKCTVNFSKYNSSLPSWKYLLSLADIDYSSYNTFSEFLANVTDLTTLSNNSEAMHYLYDNTDLIDAIKSDSNYNNSVYNILLTGTGLTNDEKYSVALPSYFYNNGQMNMAAGFPLGVLASYSSIQSGSDLTAFATLRYYASNISLVASYPSTYGVFYAHSHAYDSSKYDKLTINYSVYSSAETDMNCTLYVGLHSNTSSYTAFRSKNFDYSNSSSTILNSSDGGIRKQLTVNTPNITGDNYLKIVAERGAQPTGGYSCVFSIFKIYGY